jgi:hypothetical protein
MRMRDKRNFPSPSRLRAEFVATGFWANAYPVAVIAFGIALAMVVPDFRPGAMPVLERFNDIVATIVPSIDKFVAISRFPSVTSTFLALMWTLVPVMLYLNFRYGVMKYQSGEVSTSVFAFLFGAAFCALIALAPVIWFDMGFIHSQESVAVTALKLVSQSRFWLGALGAAACWTSSIGFSLLYRLLVNNLGFAWKRYRWSRNADLAERSLERKTGRR